MDAPTRAELFDVGAGEIAELKKAIEAMHGSDSLWVASVPVEEVFQGKAIWTGLVEVFTQHGRVKAAALHLHELVNQHIAGGAQLACKAQTAAQQKGLAVGAAIGEGWELQVDAGDAVQVERARVHVVGEFQDAGFAGSLVFL